MSKSSAHIKDVLSSKPNTLFFRADPKWIDKIVEAGTQVTLRKGTAIFKANDTADWFYVLLEGRATTKSGGLAVRSLGVGEVGGLTTSLYPPGGQPQDKGELHRSMTHEVASDSATILKVPHEVYRGLLHDAPFALHAMAFMHQRLRAKTSVIALLTGSGVDGGREPSEHDLRIAVYDTKPYDKEYINAAFKQYEKKTPNVTLKFIESKLSADTAGLAVGCKAACIFVNDACDEKILLSLRSAGVKLILLRCAGFNNVDLEGAKKMGFTVLRVPAYSPYAVAEHAFALLSTVNRKTHRAYNRVRDGNFTLSGLEGRDLHGLTVGVCGGGKIGQCFVSIALGCGMKVLVWDKFMSAADAKKFGATKVDDLHVMLRQCDVLSLHVPLTKDTHHLIDEKAIRSLPQGAIVINTSRGAIVDAKALAHALVDGHLGAAGLDVYEGETPYFFEDRSNRPVKDPVLARLVNLPNVVVTSHQAFLTDKALTAIANTTLQNALAFQKQEKFDPKAPNVVVCQSQSGAKL